VSYRYPCSSACSISWDHHKGHNDEAIFDEEVDAISGIEMNPLVNDRKTHLVLDMQAFDVLRVLRGGELRKQRMNRP
jgi:hypothetical protein